MTNISSNISKCSHIHENDIMKTTSTKMTYMKMTSMKMTSMKMTSIKMTSMKMTSLKVTVHKNEKYPNIYIYAACSVLNHNIFRYIFTAKSTHKAERSTAKQ